MRVVCAWCQKMLSEDDSGVVGKNPISYGICPDCLRRVMSQNTGSLSAYLDKFD